MTSWIEGFCLPLAEAMQLACRTVCSDLPVLRELSGGESTFFDSRGDATGALAHAIETALSRPRPRPQGPDARFTKAAVGAQWLDLYAAVLGANPVESVQPASVDTVPRLL